MLKILNLKIKDGLTFLTKPIKEYVTWLTVFYNVIHLSIIYTILLLRRLQCDNQTMTCAV